MRRTLIAEAVVAAVAPAPASAFTARVTNPEGGNEHAHLVSFTRG